MTDYINSVKLDKNALLKALPDKVIYGLIERGLLGMKGVKTSGN